MNAFSIATQKLIIRVSWFYDTAPQPSCLQLENKAFGFGHSASHLFALLGRSRQLSTAQPFTHSPE